MSMTDAPTTSFVESPLRFDSLCAAFQHRVGAHPDRTALQLPDGSGVLTYGDYGRRVQAIATGLASLGVGPGDTVALQLTNRPEFHLLDTAVLHLGATPFSVYNTNPAAVTTGLLHNSDATVFVTEEAFLPVVREAVAGAPTVQRVITVDGGDADLTLAELEALDAPDGFDFEASWRAVGGDAVCTIVYTSGTTGAPKGVQHTHAGLLFGLDSMNLLCPVSEAGRVVSYLPMAHIAERYISHYASLAYGYSITCVPDPTQLAAALAMTRPTRFFGVPRIYEKLRGAILAAIDGEQDPGRKAGMQGALDAGLAKVRAEQAGEEPTAEQQAAFEQADELVLSKFRAKLGMDQLEWSAVAAAPTPYVVLEFFHAIGVRVAELWGMSECVLSTSNPPNGRIKLGSVGYHLPNVQVRLADDGEILVKGPNVMCGYRKDPEKTADAVDADGWLHSGDIAEADEDGYLRIVDRKKELIINAAGKNMSPAHIEMTIKGESNLIAQVVAIGDARQYVTALIVLDPETVVPYAANRGIDTTDIAALAEHADIHAQIAAAVERGNAKLARVEQLKAFTVLPVAWVPGGDELTPTMKMKRKVIDEKYADVIAGLYG
ncbi:AMP-binding protein [Conexibacter sp. W3-3-2]|uniref:AMP-dependent synthetase/ligase n=1 Tax=Conexibacter sp. W3-3-2 TaxID=2675227 RepID=UPI0012B86E63|nr:long-chain fatty acid--CoA ligase [Conexibacter sp. W3-3-2]MTD45865.1 AMP-binding protein [Conexibacter sp. W3-3-2]